MVTKSQKVRVIIFISTIVSIFLYILFLLVGQKLFTENDTYFIKFKKQSVTGVNVGQDVKYYGITIGKVMDISINKDNISQIILTIDIKKGTPIKETVVANMSYIGITGLKGIELTGGENSDKDLEPGSYIRAGQDALSNITGKAEIITGKIELLLNNVNELLNLENRNKISGILINTEKFITSLDSLTVNINELVVSSEDELNETLKNINSLVIDTKTTMNTINTLVKNTNNHIDGEELKTILNNIVLMTNKLSDERIDQIINSLNNTLTNTEKTVSHIDRTILKGRKNFLSSIELLKEALYNLNEFSMLINDNPDIILRGKSDE